MSALGPERAVLTGGLDLRADFLGFAADFVEALVQFGDTVEVWWQGHTSALHGHGYNTRADSGVNYCRVL
jgi:hypothetical protein